MNETKQSVPCRESRGSLRRFAAAVGGGDSRTTAVLSFVSGDLSVPSKLGGCPVASIGEYAFYKCSGLTSVTIPEGVTSIGDYAFYNCSKLMSVHISDLAAWCEIGFGYYGNPLVYAHHLYLGDDEITSVTIPEGVTRISA